MMYMEKFQEFATKKKKGAKIEIWIYMEN